MNRNQRFHELGVAHKLLLRNVTRRGEYHSPEKIVTVSNGRPMVAPTNHENLLSLNEMALP